MSVAVSPPGASLAPTFCECRVASVCVPVLLVRREARRPKQRDNKEPIRCNTLKIEGRDHVQVMERGLPRRRRSLEHRRRGSR